MNYCQRDGIVPNVATGVKAMNQDNISIRWRFKMSLCNGKWISRQSLKIHFKRRAVNAEETMLAGNGTLGMIFCRFQSFKRALKKMAENHSILVFHPMAGVTRRYGTLCKPALY